MKVRRLRLAAPLANTSGAFRSLKLSPPFRIERWSEERLADLIVEMEGETDWQPDPRLQALHCIPLYGKTGHVVTASIELRDYAGTKDMFRFHEEIDAFTNRLERQIEVIALAEASPVALSSVYWIERDEGGDVPISSVESVQRLIPNSPCSLTVDRARVLSHVISSLETFRPKPFVAVALDHWNHALTSIPLHMQLLSLVTALEVLLNPAQTELKHRVTRFAAVLLGENRESAQEIYEGLGKVYDVRSKAIHSGDVAAAKNVPFLLLRRWVSAALCRVWHLNLSKPQLCSTLNQLGFGEGQELLSSVNSPWSGAL